MARTGMAAGRAAAIVVLAGLTTTARAQDAAGGLREGVVAIVNDDIISSYDVSQRIRLILATSGIQVTDQNRSQIEQEAVNELIDEHLEMQEIRRQEKQQKFSIAADDSEVDQRIGDVAQQTFHMSPTQFNTALTNAGIGAETLRSQIRAQLSWERWISGRYGGSRLKISQSQISSVVAAREAAAAEPQYLLAEIFIDATQAGGMQQAQTAADQLITQLQQGAAFPAVAQRFSALPTAAVGGDAGWLTASEIPAEVRAAVDQLRPGELSKPIATQNGVYIVLLRDKHAGATSQIVDLKQAAISLSADAPADAVDAAERKLVALRGQLHGCQGLESIASKVDGVVAGDLGEADVKDLKAEFRDAAMRLSVGQVSDPIRTSAGLHLLALCGRRQAGVDVPSADEIEAKLRDDRLALISKRQLDRKSTRLNSSH